MIRLDKFTQEAVNNMSRYQWKKTWTFWPRYEWNGQKRMRMFSTCYRGRRIIKGPGTDVIIVKWLLAETFMFEKLRGNI